MENEALLRSKRSHKKRAQGHSLGVMVHFIDFIISWVEP